MTQKDKIWIFGDSYGDPNCIKDPNSFSWVSELHKTYDVTNFCIRGTGANYTIANFNDQVHSYKSNLKDINLIFIIPSVYRLNFSFYKKAGDQVLTKFIVNGDTMPSKRDKINKKIKLYSKKYKDFVNNFFKYYLYPNYSNDTLLKIIGNISLYSRQFKSVLCYVVNDKPTVDINKIINYDNFYFVDSMLSDISNAESIGQVRLGEDNRNNHFNEHNNKVMFEQTTNWINDRKPFDISEFNN
tara:strand:+ start:66 stop:791 length:726 start_codon:yes stop_codon:yes gene_type:complete